jgi:hypothetical protein
VRTELFDRYVHQVGRRLPKRQRADVEQELNSLLLDALEERSAGAEAAGDVTEEDQVAVLEEFGPPAEMAARYTSPRRYLIGPRMYDLYWTVVAAVGGALTLAFAILGLLATFGQPETLGALGSSLLELLESYFGALIGAFGWVTVAFFVLERVLPESAIDFGDEGAWDPRSLPPVEDRARVEVGGLIAEIVFTAIALVVFNVFPEWVGINFWASINDAPTEFTQIPLLAPVFFTLYLPLLNVSWLLKIALNVLLLRQGRWQRWTRVADFFLAGFGVYIAARMAFGPDLLTLEGIRDASLRDLLSRFVPLVLRVVLYLGLLGSVVEAIRKLWRVFSYSETVGRVRAIVEREAGREA